MDEYIYDSIDEVISDQRMDEIDYEYFIDGIEYQLNNPMEHQSLKNFLKKFENSVDSSELKDEEKSTLKEKMYINIVNKIQEKFNFTMTTDSISKKMAKYFYKFFVLDYLDNITNFISQYLITYADSLKTDLLEEYSKNEINFDQNDPQGENSLFLLIINIKNVIKIISSYNLSFDEILNIMNSHPDASASVKEMINYNEEFMGDTENIVDFIFSSLINENEGFSNILTSVQWYIYSNFIKGGETNAKL